MADAETRVRNALSYLSPNCPRQEWVYIGMGVHDELGEAGWAIFDEWSAGGESYKAADTRAVWKSFKQGGGKGFGYVVDLAKREGFDAKVKGYTKPTPEQVAEREAKHAERQKVHAAEEAIEEAEAAARAQKRWANAKDATDNHPYLKLKGVKAHGLKIGIWWKTDHVTGKKFELHNVLYLPLKDTAGVVRSLQGITAEGDKIYMSGGAKMGNFLPIGKPTNNAEGERIYGFAEGYATAASAHELTGITVVCCFDVGNMERLVRLMREKRPGAELIIFADNDTKTAEKGRGNPGMEVAFKVGKECKATVVVNPHGGDFNDLVLEHGAEAAQAAFAARSVPTAAYKPPKPPAAPPPPPIKIDLDAGEQPLFHQYFEMLGYDGAKYYLYDRRKRQVRDFTIKDESDAFLFELAPREFWESRFSVTREGGAKFDRVVATEHMHDVARARGIYRADRERGHGVWHDDGRVVFHHGDCLSIDGAIVDVDQIRSKYVYPMADSRPHPADERLSVKDGKALYRTAEMMRWVKPGSSALLCGWLFLAPICGALPWRPHLWLTGPAGSGKSYIQTYFIGPLLNEFGPAYDGGTSTEAGIRQGLKVSAVPVSIDEFEPNDEASRARLEPVLTLIRQASSEGLAVTAKGSPGGSSAIFQVRSMFFLSSINAMLTKDSDNSRITQIALRPPGDGEDDDDQWEKLEEAIHALVTDQTLKNRMLRRAIDSIPLIQKHLKMFTKVGAQSFKGSQRLGDQFGTLLCGLWFLLHDEEPTLADAQKAFSNFEWQEHQESGPSDHAAALSEILDKTIHVNSDFGSVTVYELLRDSNLERQVVGAIGKFGKGVATDILARHGMRIVVWEEKAWMAFNTSQTSLRKIVKDLPAFADLRATLKRVPGSTTFKNKSYRFMGYNGKAVGVPLEAALGEDLDAGPPL